jgi:hypothetical protein
LQGIYRAPDTSFCQCSARRTGDARGESHVAGGGGYVALAAASIALGVADHGEDDRGDLPAVGEDSWIKPDVLGKALQRPRRGRCARSDRLRRLRTMLEIFVTIFDRRPAPQGHGEHR